MTLATQLSALAVQLIAISISARVLGPEGRGLADALQSTVLLFYRIGQFGLIAPIIYWYGKRQASASVFAGTLAFLAVVASAVLCAAQVAMFAAWGDTLYPNIQSAWFALSLLVLPGELLFIFSLTVMRAMERALLYNAVTLAAAIAAVVAVAACLLVWPTVSGLVLARSVSAMFAGALGPLVLRRVSSGRWRVDWDLARRLVRGGSVLWVGSMCNYLYNAQLGPMMLNALSDATNAGYFAVASRVAGMLLFVPLAVEAFLYPRAAGIAEERARDLVASTCRHTLLWACVMGAGLVLFSRPAIVAVAGAAFAPAALTVALLVPGMALHCITMMVMTMLMNKRQFAQMSAVNVFLALLSILAAVALIPQWGANGLAAATSAVYGVGACTSIWLFRRATGLGARELVVLRHADVQQYVRLCRRLRAAATQRP
jgi:O-antigen/teichoic acid export membrane protein